MVQTWTLTVWATGGGWISPHSFYWAITVRNTLMRHFFYCLTFQVDGPQSFWYLICGHSPLRSQAIVCQSWTPTQILIFAKKKEWPPPVIQLVWEKSFVNKKSQSKWATHWLVQNVWHQTKIWEAMAKKLIFWFLDTRLSKKSKFFRGLLLSSLFSIPPQSIP